MPKSESTARLEVRVSPEQYRLFKRAAELQGRTLSDFVIAVLSHEARQVIEQEILIRLSLEDQQCFAQALIEPPEPNEALERAFARHRALIQPMPE
jgi:uncharacterized protein (DUF1778 family)